MACAKIGHTSVILLYCFLCYLPQGYLTSHQLDRKTLGLDYDTFWSVVGKTMRAELVEEAVLTPLTILCQDIASRNLDISEEDIQEHFDMELVEQDVIPVLEMAM